MEVNGRKYPPGWNHVAQSITKATEEATWSRAETWWSFRSRTKTRPSRSRSSWPHCYSLQILDHHQRTAEGGNHTRKWPQLWANMRVADLIVGALYRAGGVHYISFPLFSLEAPFKLSLSRKLNSQIRACTHLLIFLTTMFLPNHIPTLPTHISCQW